MRGMRSWKYVVLWIAMVLIGAFLPSGIALMIKGAQVNDTSTNAELGENANNVVNDAGEIYIENIEIARVNALFSTLDIAETDQLFLGLIIKDQTIVINGEDYKGVGVDVDLIKLVHDPSLESMSLGITPYENLETEYKVFDAESITLYIPNQALFSRWEDYLKLTQRQEDILQNPDTYGVQKTEYTPGNEGYLIEIPEDIKTTINELQNDWGLVVGEVRVMWEEDLNDIKMWLEQLDKTMQILGQDFVNEIRRNRNDSMLYVFFKNQLFEDHNALYDGFYNQLQINLQPYLPMDTNKELIHENGYEPKEALYILLHELGHFWAQTYKDMNPGSLNGLQMQIDNTRSPTSYPLLESEQGLTALSYGEDVAESFALSILMPEYMQKNFPIRYAWFTEHAFGGREFNFNFNPPTSMLDRLTEN